MKDSSYTKLCISENVRNLSNINQNSSRINKRKLKIMICLDTFVH